MSNPITLQERTRQLRPDRRPAPALNLWLYRRIADRKNFAEGTYRGDVCLVNWPQNDYWLGNLYRRARTRPPATSTGQAAQPVAPVLDADGGPAAGRQGRAGRGCGSATTWSARRTGWRSTPTSASRGESGGVHRHRAARRHRRPAEADGQEARGVDGRAVPGLGRHRQLPHRPAPVERLLAYARSIARAARSSPPCRK